MTWKTSLLRYRLRIAALKRPNCSFFPLFGFAIPGRGTALGAGLICMRSSRPRRPRSRLIIPACEGGGCMRKVPANCSSPKTKPMLEKLFGEPNRHAVCKGRNQRLRRQWCNRSGESRTLRHKGRSALPPDTCSRRDLSHPPAPLRRSNSRKTIHSASSKASLPFDGAKQMSFMPRSFRNTFRQTRRM